MSGFTPGPWVGYVGGAASYVEFEDKVNTWSSVQIHNGKTPVCDVLEIPGIVDEEEHKANEALISAAPELLDALESIVNSLVEEDEEGLIEHAAQIQKARAAIAKARGD